MIKKYNRQNIVILCNFFPFQYVETIIRNNHLVTPRQGVKYLRIMYSIPSTPICNNSTKILYHTTLETMRKQTSSVTEDFTPKFTTPKFTLSFTCRVTKQIFQKMSDVGRQEGLT